MFQDVQHARIGLLARILNNDNPARAIDRARRGSARLDHPGRAIVGAFGLLPRSSTEDGVAGAIELLRRMAETRDALNRVTTSAVTNSRGSATFGIVSVRSERVRSWTGLRRSYDRTVRNQAGTPRCLEDKGIPGNTREGLDV